MFLSEQELAKRIDHNNNIYTVPQEIEKGMLFGEFLIVKLMYYTDHTITESGLIEPAYKVGETADGRPKPTFSDFPFSPIGVIMKVGDGEQASKYQIGDKVWLDYRALRNQSYDFLLDMSNPVAKPQGYVRIPSPLIHFVEERKETN